MSAPQRITLKVSHAAATRRIRLTPEQLTWSTVTARVAELFGLDANTLPALVYIDEDGDKITLDSDRELLTLWTDSMRANQPMPHLFLPSSPLTTQDTSAWVLANAATDASSVADASERAFDKAPADEQPRNLGKDTADQNAVEDDSDGDDEQQPLLRNANESTTTLVPNNMPPDVPENQPRAVPSHAKQPAQEQSQAQGHEQEEEQARKHADADEQQQTRAGEQKDESNEEQRQQDTSSPYDDLPPLGTQICELARQFVATIQSNPELVDNARRVADQSIDVLQRGVLFLLGALREGVTRAHEATRDAAERRNERRSERQHESRQNTTASASSATSGQRDMPHGAANGDAFSALASSATTLAHTMQQRAAEFAREAQWNASVFSERAQDRATTLAQTAQVHAMSYAEVAQRHATALAERAAEQASRAQAAATAAAAAASASMASTASRAAADTASPAPNMPEDHVQGNLYAEQLKHLKEMGYNDEDHLMHLLHAYGGDLTRTVEALVGDTIFEAEDADDLYA
ncbi:hypothetical protein THASP1DRAFT_29290 [Thamnocephalis sphaerospora]|uniref:PB1 domain-containing protein n=1 Tax=Thamnocephalis sphaerospora TaxID=78915 RepID=A0A4P9XS23_9FUNG|nr:hypothetical protein THASP1DRAFT_29290 [Thamnocephalis sphaerospora]|eukprot:RKP08924.1 hypothetical protein THASP1DRAFT_29290 [Thamnocephalis sphaerospora]